MSEGWLGPLRTEGWAVVPGVVDAATIGVLRAALERHIGPGRPEGRLLNAWEVIPEVRRLAAHPAVLALAATALGGPAVPFQTLDFPRGTEQPPHRDSLLFDTWPRGGVVAAWVALEDVDAGNGPLVIWPRTHLGPPPTAASVGLDAGRFDAEVVDRATTAEVAGREAVEVEVAAGDVVLWLGATVHGGAPVREPARSRWSHVTHHVAAGRAYVSPFGCDLDRGELLVRDQLVDVRTGRRVPHRADGRRVAYAHLPGGRSRLVVAPGPAARAGLVARDLARGAPSARRWASARVQRAARRARRSPQRS